MIRVILLMLLIHTILSYSSGQEFKGTIINKDLQPLPNVSIFLNHKWIAFSNEKGSFSFTVMKEDSFVCFSLVGYLDTCIKLSNLTDTIIIYPKIIYSKEVIVSRKGNNPEKIISSIGGSFYLKPDSVKNLPTLTGEADPIKLLQLTPGITKNEFSTGLNVRGGSSDQNLVILDDAVIYYPTHLSGFLSVFNPFIIDRISIHRSGVPVEYPGRLSSITILDSKKSHMEKIEYEGNIGLLLSNLFIKTPIGDNFTLYIAGRKSYFDLTIKPISKKFIPHSPSFFNNSEYNFYDLNLSLVSRLSKRDNFFISLYHGNDFFKLNKISFNLNYQLDWGNDAISVRWLHYFNNKHISKTKFYYSNGKFNFFFGQNDLNFKLFSRINDYSLGHEHNFFFQKWRVNVGIQILSQTVIPNNSEAKLNELEANFGTPNIYHLLTISNYFNTIISVTPKINITLGARLSLYNHLGPYYQFIRSSFDNRITDTLYYSPNKKVISYKQVEPQVYFNYLLNSNSSLKFSFVRNVQFVQLVNVSSVSLPTDFWMPASNLLKPSYVFQTNLGFTYLTHNKKYILSHDLFYKYMGNLVEFKQGIVSSITKATMEENITAGKGRAYGYEFLIEKNSGKIKGWLRYTLSKSERIFKEINNGRPFPSKYDRTHDITLTVIYTINKKWNISGIFTFATGTAVTLPIGRYMIGENIVNQYVDYNSFRMPPYHRLDIAASRIIKSNKIEQELTFSIYNLYNRQNPYFMYFHVTGDLRKYKLEVMPKYVSIFPIMPSIAYKFKF